MKNFIKYFIFALALNGVFDVRDAVSQTADEVKLATQIGTITVADAVSKLAGKWEYPIKVVLKSGQNIKGVVLSKEIEDGQIRIAQDTGEVVKLNTSSIESLSLPISIKTLEILRPKVIPFNIEGPTQLNLKRAFEEMLGKFNLKAEFTDSELLNNCRAALDKLKPQLISVLNKTQLDTEGKKALANFKTIEFAGNPKGLLIKKSGDKLLLSFSCEEYSTTEEVETELFRNL